MLVTSNTLQGGRVPGRQPVLAAPSGQKEGAVGLSSCPLKEARGEKAPLCAPILARSLLLLLTAQITEATPTPAPLCRDPWRLESQGWGPEQRDRGEHTPSADRQGEEL